NNVWDVIPVLGQIVTTATNDAVGYVRTSGFLYVYSGMGSLSILSRYAEFSRFQPLGTTLRLSQDAAPGSQVTAAISIAAAQPPIPYPGWGEIFIDPAQILAFVPLGTVPASRLLDVDFVLPDDPALHGLTIHVQDVVLEPSGIGYFTNSISPILL